MERKIANKNSTITPQTRNKIDIFKADGNKQAIEIENNPLQQITDAYAKLVKSSPPKVSLSKKNDLFWAKSEK